MSRYAEQRVCQPKIGDFCECRPFECRSDHNFGAADAKLFQQLSDQPVSERDGGHQLGLEISTSRAPEVHEARGSNDGHHRVAVGAMETRGRGQAIVGASIGKGCELDSHRVTSGRMIADVSCVRTFQRREGFGIPTAKEEPSCQPASSSRTLRVGHFGFVR